MCESSVTIKIFCIEYLNVANTKSKIIRTNCTGEMSSSIRSNAIWLFLFLCATVTICQDVEQTSEIPEDSEDESSIWMEYEFGTGAGNREGIVRNIVPSDL